MKTILLLIGILFIAGCATTQKAEVKKEELKPVIRKSQSGVWMGDREVTDDF